MSSPGPKRPTNRASKDQILAAFDQLNSEYKKLGSAAAAAPSKEQHRGQCVLNPRMPPVTTPRGRTMHPSRGRIAALLSCARASAAPSAGLSAKLTAEASRLASLHHEVDSQAKQLTELHDIRSRTTRSRP